MVKNTGTPKKPDLSAAYVWPRELCCWDEGWTGKLLRKVPDSWWNGLQIERDRLPAEQQLPANFNPWERLANRPGPEQWRQFLEAGASQWRAWTKLAHMATGAATLSSDPFKGLEEGLVLPLSRLHKLLEHCFPWIQGREFLVWLKMKRPELVDSITEAEAVWKRRQAKKGSIKPKPLPPLDHKGSRVPKHALDLVRRWLTDPGYCWWSDRAIEQVFRRPGAYQQKESWSVSQTCQRLGLRKAGITEVSKVTITDSVIRLHRRDGTISGRRIITPDFVPESPV